MATTYGLIASTTLVSAASNIEFTSIPATYTDLYLVCSLRSDRSAANDGVKARFNGAGSDTNHSGRSLVGDGSSASSSTNTFVRIGYASAATATSDTFGSSEMYIPNYAGSTNKSMSSFGAQEGDSSSADLGASASLWSDTSAITSISIIPNTGPNWVSGSSAYLYGITKA